MHTPENIANELLASDGIGAIWKLHLIAASAHQCGSKRAAEILIKVADAAEELWWQRVVELGEAGISD
jgi:hypothetical protein